MDAHKPLKFFVAQLATHASSTADFAALNPSIMTQLLTPVASAVPVCRQPQMLASKYKAIK